MNISDPIVTSQSFQLPQQVVWTAITEHKQMIQWFFNNIPDFKAEVGFETDFLIELEDRKFTHLWKITEVIDGQKIVYSWRYAEYPEGDATVTFELAEENDATTLTVTATGTETFPQHIPEFKRESGVNGWNYFIKESLVKYLS